MAGKQVRAQYMQDSNWKPYAKLTTDSKHCLPVSPDLVQRHLTPDAPNQLWCGDITCNTATIIRYKKPQESH